jgi:ABC-type polysaccharide/polyol phosphate export permease
MTFWKLAATSPIMTKDMNTTASTRAVILPSPGGPFAVSIHELGEAARLAPVWLHAGWIDVVWRFRRTRLGAFWHTLGIAAFVLVMGTIWSTILHQDPFQYFRYVTASLIVWGLVASFITDATGILVAGQSTALSMRFPFVAFAFAHVWRSLLLFAHHFVFYIAVMVFTLYSPGWTVLYAIPALLLIIANGVWMSLLAGIICLRVRDLIPATASAMQIAMFVTPVFWPKNLLGPELAFAADFNPLYHLTTILRDPLLGATPPLVSWLWVLATLIVGSTLTLWVYGKKRDRMPYWY